MSTESLKLTGYFAERERTDGRFLAEAMLDLFGESQVATSVMLRGIASFGPRHVIRTDESLSLSEDPPVAVAAVDTRDKIMSLVDRVAAMTGRGLLTLERARLVTGADAVTLPDADAVKLTVYVGRQARVAGREAHLAICNRLYHMGFAGVSVFLGVDGTAHGRRRRARFFSLNVDVPLMIIAVGTPAQAAGAAAELGALVPTALLTVERVRVCKRGGALLAPPELPAGADNHRLWQKVMVHTSEATRHEGVPIHRALIRRLYESPTASGATVLRGIWGFHGDHEPHGDKLFQLGRQVPVTTIIVDTPDRIAASFEIVDELTARHGLVTSELVPAMLTVDGGQHRGDLRLG